MFKKILTAMLVLSLSAAFVSCKNTENTDVTANGGEIMSAEVSEDGIDYEDGLSEERYDGYEFRMLLRKGRLADQYLEEDSEDVIASAVYNRNKAVEAKYGITITATESSSSGWETDALNSILAGDDAYDLVLAHSRAAFVYAINGAAYNINDIESIHLDKPWWSKNIKENCDVNGYLYVLDGDISTMGLANAMCLFFNKNIFDELGFDYPYEMVRDGEWTFDEFAYLAKKGGKDLDGDGVMDGYKDRFGFVATEWNTPISILYTGGMKIYDKGEDGKLELTLYSNKTVDIFDEFFSLMDNEACFLKIQEGAGTYTGGDLFSEGRAMMHDGSLGVAGKYRGMDDDFGIIPYPKFTEDDEYATNINGISHLVIIPITVSDVERTGAITEALCAYSSRDVIPAFYDVALKTKYSRDEDSEEMMDLIRDSIIYDIGYVAGGTFESIGRNLAKSESHDFASTYAAGESAALKKLDDFNRDYGHFE
ncbi:MAG: extracellular solute-binding protein [Clostridia bacterium]|nr:extracellular solute-binding protein [Clostridia bacterium]